MDPDTGTAVRGSLLDASLFLQDYACTLRSVCIAHTPLPVTCGGSMPNAPSCLVGGFASLPSPRSVVCKIAAVNEHPPTQQSFPWLPSEPCRVANDVPLRQLELLLSGGVCCGVDFSRESLQLWSVGRLVDEDEGSMRPLSVAGMAARCCGLLVGAWESGTSAGRGLLMCQQISDVISVAEFFSPAAIANGDLDSACASARIACGCAVAVEAAETVGILVEESGTVAVTDLRCSSALPVDRMLLFSTAAGAARGRCTSAAVVHRDTTNLAASLVVGVSGTGSLFSFDLRAPKAHLDAPSPQVRSAPPRVVCSSGHAGAVLAVGEQIAIVDGASGEVTFCFSGHASTVLTCCAVGNTFLSSAADGSLALWSLR